LIGRAIRDAVDRARVAGDEVDDVVIGTVLSARTAGMNIARNGSLAAGLPASVSAQTVDRQCSVWGAYCGIAVAGCPPEEMGIGAIYAIPKLLEERGLKVGDIGLWEP
jgi:acetyl-CoA acetyltransferase